jgi:hypothetical protein
MKHPIATRKDHERFCVNEGWTRRKSATGKTGTHHINDELPLPDGRILLTRVSHPVNRTGYGAGLWSHILRDRLDVTPQEFWACVNDQAKPDRGGISSPPAESIPVGVVATLVEQFHIPESGVRAMTKDEAVRRMIEAYAQETRSP